VVRVAGAASEWFNQVTTDVSKFQNMSTALTGELQRILLRGKGRQIPSAHGTQRV
jgi:hypothetical protein